jgi:hypothetical protein
MIQSQTVIIVENLKKRSFLERYPSCNVGEYFSCVARIQKLINEGGFANYSCNTPCEQIDYIAWQDMNELPNNIFPKIMDSISFDQKEELSSESDDDDEEVSIFDLKIEIYFRNL